MFAKGNRSDQVGQSSLMSPRTFAEIKLSKEQVDLNNLTPKLDLVELAVSLIARQECVASPGYAYITNTIDVFESKARAVEFQIKFMQKIKDYMLTNLPDCISAQPYLDRQDTELNYKTDVVGIEAFQFSAYDGKAVQSFHLDSLRQSYVSLIYGPNQNIVGGVPRLFDALRLKEDLGLSNIREIVNLNRLKFLYTEIHTPYDLEGSINPSYLGYVDQYTILFDKLNSAELPMLIFSNRLENGILHGATTPTTDISGLPTDRPISYVAIKHMPFAKSEPFSATHKLLL